MTTDNRAEQIAAVKELMECGHGFLSKEGVEYLTKPFGFVGSTYTARNTSGLKGLTLNDGLTECDGQDAAALAEEICKHLGVSYMPMLGRGSRLRSCCDALLKHLEG